MVVRVEWRGWQRSEPSGSGVEVGNPAPNNYYTAAVSSYSYLIPSHHSTLTTISHSVVVVVAVVVRECRPQTSAYLSDHRLI